MSDLHSRDQSAGQPLLAQSGREKAAEPTDPYEPTVVRLVTPGHDGMAAMARAIVEEFALLGWSRRRVLSIFTTPTFAAPHGVYLERGADYVESLVDDVMGPAGEES
ncbi:MAG: hypothetical protein R3B59_00030 [Dehalococcoidia bacterium]